MSFKELLGKSENGSNQSKIILSNDYVAEQVSKLTLEDYRDPEKFQLQLCRTLVEVCCMNEGKDVGDEKFEDLVKDCSCQKQLVDIMQEYAIQAIQCYLCQHYVNSFDDKWRISGILGVIFVLRSAFNDVECTTYEDIVSAIIDHEYSYEEIPWSFSYFKYVFEYVKDRCYNEIYEATDGTRIAHIWDSHMLLFLENACEDDIQFIKSVTVQGCMPINWGDYFYTEAKKLSEIWTAGGFLNSYWLAQSISECFPDITSEVYKAFLLRLIRNPDKYLMVIGKNSEMENEFKNLPENEFCDEDSDEVTCNQCYHGNGCKEDTIYYPVAINYSTARREFIWMFEDMLEDMYDLNKYQSVEFAISNYWEEILNVAYNYTNGSVLTFTAEVLEKAFHVSKDKIEDYIAATTYEKIRDWNAWACTDGNDVTTNWENAEKLCKAIDNHDVVPESSFQLVNLLSNPIVFKIVDRENPYIVPSFNV